MALGSLTEVQNQLLIARDIEYITQQEFASLAQQTIEINKITDGLIKKSKSLIPNS